jgi:iron complex outermembrane receptor protein
MLRYGCLCLLLIITIPGFAQTSADSTVALKEVAVTNRIPALEMKNGLLVMNLENNPLAAGSTVLEMLKRMPGVLIDEQNNITINGKSGVGFLMDGRLQQMSVAQMIQVLSNTPANAIATIELIKNPSAKYDAAGTAGLINIVSKKVRVKGFNGTFMESTGMGKRFGNGMNAVLNFRSDRLTVFANASYLYRNPLSEVTLERTLNTGNGTDRIFSGGQSESFTNSVPLKGGLEYALSRKTTMGLTIGWMPSAAKEFQYNHLSIAGNSLPYNYFASLTGGREDYSSPSAALYLLHSFDTAGTQLSFTADYTGFLYNQSRANENHFFTGDHVAIGPALIYRNSNDLHLSVWTQKLDFFKALTRTLKMETGIKAGFAENRSHTVLERNDIDGSSFYKDTIFSNEYRYQERILAAYISLLKTFGKLNIQAGLRGEQTHIRAAIAGNNARLDRDYFNLFPNLAIDYTANEKNSFQLTYSYRIDRPSYDQVSAIKVFNDPLNYSTGNPQLQPQYSHVINLEFNHNQFITNSLNYTHIRNSIYNYPFTREGSQVQADTVINFASRYMLAYNLMVQQQLKKWYQVQLSGTAGYTHFNGRINGEQVGSEAVVAYVSLNNDLFLPHKFRLQLNAHYTSPFKDGIQRYASRANMDIVVQKKLLKDRLNISLGIYDLFYTSYNRVSSVLSDQAYQITMRNDTRRGRLTLMYRLGNMRIDRKIKDTPGEESKRIRNAN